MQKTLIALTVLVSALALAACAGTAHKKVKHPNKHVSTGTISAHDSDVTSAIMGGTINGKAPDTATDN